MQIQSSYVPRHFMFVFEYISQEKKSEKLTSTGIL